MTASAGSPPEGYPLPEDTASSGSPPETSFRRTASSGNSSQDVRSNTQNGGASCLVCRAGRGLGLNLCVLRETPPGGLGEIQAPGRTFPGQRLAGRI